MGEVLRQDVARVVKTPPYGMAVLAVSAYAVYTMVATVLPMGYGIVDEGAARALGPVMRAGGLVGVGGQPAACRGARGGGAGRHAPHVGRTSRLLLSLGVALAASLAAATALSVSPFDQGHLDLLLAALDGQHDLHGCVFDPRYLRDLLLPVSGALLAAWLGVLEGLATLRAPAPAAAAALSALGLDASVTGAAVALAALASAAGRLRHAAPEDAGLALALAALLLAMLVSPASVLVVPLSLGEGPSSLLVGLCALTLAAEGLLSRRAGPAAPEVGPLLACGGMGAGVVSEEVAGLRVEWALLGGAGSGELLGWLVAGACAAALVAAAVALAAPRWPRPPSFSHSRGSRSRSGRRPRRGVPAARRSPRFSRRHSRRASRRSRCGWGSAVPLALARSPVAHAPQGRGGLRSWSGVLPTAAPPVPRPV